MAGGFEMNPTRGERLFCCPEKSGKKAEAVEPMAHSDLVIIGSGMAATRLVETLRRNGDRRSIALLGAERALPYNRIMLSPLLAGHADWQQLIAHPAEWYIQRRIELRLGHAVEKVDTVRRRLRCADGFSASYGELS